MRELEYTDGPTYQPTDQTTNQRTDRRAHTEVTPLPKRIECVEVKTLFCRPVIVVAQLNFISPALAKKGQVCSTIYNPSQPSYLSIHVSAGDMRLHLSICTSVCLDQDCFNNCSSW